MVRAVGHKLSFISPIGAEQAHMFQYNIQLRIVYEIHVSACKEYNVAVEILDPWLVGDSR